MGVEDLRPKREIPINMVDAYSPIRYVGDPTKLPTDGIEAYDTVYLLDKDGTLHKFFGIDIIAPKLTSLTIAKKLASYAQTTDMRRATDSSTQPADNSRILMDELIGSYDLLSNKSRLNTYLRDISNQTGVPFEAIQQTFDDKALQQLVADREARGEEVDLCLERTPKEREEYLQGFDSILALNNYNDLTIDGIAGVKYDPGTMYPGDLVQEVIARLSFTLKNQTFAPGTVREIMKDPQAWKNDLDQMGKILQEQAREIFELSKASYMRSEGIRDISQEQNEILMRKCDRRLKGPLRNLVFPFDFSLQGIRKFRTFDPPEPRLIY